MRLDVDVDARAARALLEGIAYRSEHPRPGLSLVLDDVLGAQRALFAAQPWPALADSTKERKRSDPATAANAETEMVGTGRLKRFLTTRGPGAQPLALNDRELRIGVPRGQSSVYYARHLAARGRNPVVPVSTVRRVAPRRLAGWLVGQ